MDITVEQVIEQISAVTPANVLLLASLVILSLGLIPTSASGEARRNLWGVLALFGIGMAAAFALLQDPTAATTGDPTIRTSLFGYDDVTSYGTWLALLSGMLIVLVGWEHVKPQRSSDYYGWLLLMLSGLIYTAGARDLTTLFLGLELVSLPTTVLLGITRSDDSGREAALKYFTLAAFASGFFLLGCSYLYGACGSTTIQVIQNKIVEQRTPFVAVALALTIIGLSFRVTAVPFHFYAPDVFTGATLPMAAAMSFIPKLAGFLGLVRLLGGTYLIKDIPPTVVLLILVVATATMTIGNCAALVQTNLRRLMAYSSIAHSGYLLLALAAIIIDGGHIAPIFNYLAAYSVMTIGLFAVVATVRPDGEAAEDLNMFNGLYARNMLAAIAMMIALLSLTGIPLTAGFWAKLQIFLTTVKSESSLVLIVAIIMALNAAIGAIYYLGLLARLFQSPAVTKTPAPVSTRLNWSTSAAALVCSVLTIVWFFVP